MGYNEIKALALSKRSDEQIKRSNEIKARNERYVSQASLGFKVDRMLKIGRAFN